jgi:hypothetical protein
MFADVAETRSAQQRIGNRVEDHIGITVPGKAAAMRHFDSAEHQWTIARESVNVEAYSGTRPQPPG